MLIDSFINRIYLYDGRLVISCDHKDGEETITIEDVETALAESGFGSDLVQRGTRKNGPTEGRAKKCPVDTFLVRGRVL